MLKTAITTTALTSGAANTLFENRIVGPAVNGDVSMTALARVLFDKRLGDGEKITICYSSVYHKLQKSDWFDTAFPLQQGDLLFMSIYNPGRSNKTWHDEVHEKMQDKGLYELVAINEYLKRACGISAMVYTNEPYDPKIPKSPLMNDRSVIFVENLNVSKWHCLAMLMPRFLNYWFQETPRTPDETALLNAFGKDTDEEFQSLVSKAAEQHDFRSAYIREMLGDFEQKYAKEKERSLSEKINATNTQINDLMTQIGNLISEKETIQEQLWGIQTRMGDVEPLTMNYFLASKNLYLRNVTPDSLDFYAVAWLNSWDPDKAKVVFDKGIGHCVTWLQYNQKYDVSNEDAYLLYRAIFLDETVRIRQWSHFVLHLRGNNPMGIISDGPSLPEIQNAIPNFHHQEHACGGTHAHYVAQCVLDHDIVGAIEQCVCATGGLNLTEEVTYQYFERALFDPASGDIIYIPQQDKFVTAKEAINYLKSKEVSA